MSHRRALVLLLAIGSLSACEPVEPGSETSEAALVKQIPVPVGLVTRTMSLDYRCSYRCAEYRRLSCVRISDQCTEEIWSAKLHADPAAASAGHVFPAFNEGATYSPKGCGPKAAQNVLYYFGVRLPIADVASHIDTIDVPFSDQIATKPDELVKGLERLLNLHATGRFSVRRRNGGPHDVANALERTRSPVIVLAQGGDHYLTVTGYDSTYIQSVGSQAPNEVEPDPSVVPAFYHVIDYPSSEWHLTDPGNPSGPTYHKVPVTQNLEMGFSGRNQWLSAIPVGTGGFDEFTYITIERTEDVCVQTCQGGLGFVPGQGAVCRGGWVEKCG